jgi:hypothetical protein
MGMPLRPLHRLEQWMRDDRTPTRAAQRRRRSPAARNSSALSSATRQASTAAARGSPRLPFPLTTLARVA